MKISSNIATKILTFKFKVLCILLLKNYILKNVSTLFFSLDTSNINTYKKKKKKKIYLFIKQKVKKKSQKQ